MSKYEVRSELRGPGRDDDGETKTTDAVAVVQLETCRTNRKDAEQDVELIKLLGRKAWITETV